MLFGKKTKNKNIYRLKTMAGARVVSEVSALILIFCLPFALLLMGIFATLDLVIKLAVVLGACAACFLLPAYGFVTWQITVTETGVVGWSLVKRRNIEWASLKKLTRKSNFNWQRYVLEYDGGDMTFPLWFDRCDALVNEIRSRLPADFSPSKSGDRVFKQDTISYFMQISQVGFGLILAITAAFFSVHLLSQSRTSIWDSLLVIVFVLLLGLCMFFRSIVVALMPRKMVVGPDDLQLETVFFKKKIEWNKIEGLKASNPLLPEGFMLDTREGSFLIGTGFDALDEFVQAVKEKKSD